jgi:hypothetical protein
VSPLPSLHPYDSHLTIDYLALDHSSCRCGSWDVSRGTLSSYVQQYLHTALIWQLATCTRADELGDSCVNVEDIFFPQQERHYDKDGFPKFLRFLQRDHKANTDGTKLPPLEFKLSRNYQRPDVCPVVTTVLWLVCSGLTHGPLFPALNKSHTVLYEGHENKTHTLIKWEGDLFKDMGSNWEDISTHSIRKSVVKWAARCGASTFQTRGGSTVIPTCVIYVHVLTMF